jgi:hypothetical protein
MGQKSNAFTLNSISILPKLFFNLMSVLPLTVSRKKWISWKYRVCLEYFNAIKYVMEFLFL